MDKTERKKIRESKIVSFNPNESGLLHHGIFGLPFGEKESELVIVPVPFEATVSYAGGTALGPKAILEASTQIDLHDPLCPDGWREGIAMQEIPKSILNNSNKLRKKTVKYLEKYSKGIVDKKLQAEINEGCEGVMHYVKEKTRALLAEGKMVGLLGGDHSTPLGYIEALSEREDSFGVLHLDAHMDLRNAYEGITYSHASIFYNTLKTKKVGKLVQVGIRDFCEEENELVKRESERVKVFTDYELKKAVFKGKTWDSLCEEIVGELPEKVYVSFDIDALLPYLAQNTGTPVPGGFTLEEAVYLIEKVVDSGRKIIGFDLCEVAPGKEGEWDGNVGARVLYKLSLLSLKNRNI